MSLLIKIFLLFFTVSFLNENDVVNWYAQIDGVNDSYVSVDIRNQNDEKLSYEVNGKNIEYVGNVLKISRKSFHNNKVSVIASGVKEKLYLLIKYRGNEKIYVTENQYRIGYYLVSLNSNCTIIHTSFDQKIVFLDYDKYINLHNISLFNNALLPSFIFDAKQELNDCEAILYLFIEDGAFKRIPYNITNYAFYFSLNYNDKYFFSLKEMYSLDNYSNDIYLGTDNLIENIIYPNNISFKSFNALFSFNVLDITFLFLYEVNLEHTLFDDEIIRISEVETKKEYEKEILVY